MSVQVEVFDERRQVLDVGLQGVVAILRSLGLPEPHVIGHHHPMVAAERADHVSVEVAPRRLAVQAHDDLAVTRPLVHEVLDEAVTVVGVGSERERAVEGLVEGNHLDDTRGWRQAGFAVLGDLELASSSASAEPRRSQDRWCRRTSGRRPRRTSDAELGDRPTPSAVCDHDQREHECEAAEDHRAQAEQSGSRWVDDRIGRSGWEGAGRRSGARPTPGPRLR